MTDNTPTAALLIIGNEILSGRTQDTNLAYLAQKLGAAGIIMAETRVVRDKSAEIIAALNALRRAYTYVFTCGGIGPTHDDITTATVGAAFGRAIKQHPDALKALQSHYPPELLNEARLKMAAVPEGATLIENPVSKAPGFRLENVFVLAGVPRIFQAMLDFIMPTLTGGTPIESRTLSTSLAEGTIAATLSSVQARFPALDIGSYPYFRQGVPGVSLVLRGTDSAALDAASIELEAALTALKAGA
jgi:molybdenum cofactor synthesis domain-containing protein